MSTIDRAISLDTAIAQGMPDDLSQQPGSGGLRREASDTDRQAFERALAGKGDGGDDAAAAQDGDAPAEDGMPRPFPMFGAPVSAPAAGAAPGADPAASVPSALSRSLAEAADRLLVGDGGNGRNEVRIDLKDEVLPGVTVSVYEDEGRLVAAFVCASENSRERLNACARALADELAESLKRAVLVRVTTDDPEDPCLHEAASAAA